MSQLVSAAAGNSSYNTYDTKIPEILQTADIVEAFRLYHYGKDNFTNTDTPASNSIYSHLKTLQDNINAVLAKASYTSSAPAAPETGRLWVDSDTGEMYVYSGTAWILVSAGGTGGTGTSSDSFFLMGA
jgi:hypothetical protein